jgi:hypothetical protein
MEAAADLLKRPLKNERFADFRGLSPKSNLSADSGFADAS